jgi:cellulose synthase (UDP-forming)
VTNSRLQSRYRHSFWGEIYESVLALYILRPTMATLINPKRGKFNVTEKGGLLPQDYFDYKIVRPHLIIIGLLIIALIVGVARWVWLDFADTEVLLLNIAWAIFNLLTIAAAVAVGRETRQLRGSVRLGLEMPGVVRLPDGQSLVTRSRNLSTTGGLFLAPRPEGIELGRCRSARAGGGCANGGAAGAGDCVGRGGAARGL